MIDYGKMTEDEFKDILGSVMDELHSKELLALPGVYETLAENLNYQVLAIWKEENEEDKI